MLNTHAEATFQIPDVTKVLAVPDLLKIYMQPAVIALAEKIETDLLNLYSQFTANTAVGTGGIGSDGSGDRSPAETALFNAKVPASQPKYLVVDGARIRSCGRFRASAIPDSAGDAGLRALVDGNVGKIKDFFVFRSQFVQKTGTRR